MNASRSGRVIKDIIRNLNYSIFGVDTAPRVAYLVLLAMNVADAYLTLGWMNAGVLTEGNPLMESLLAHSVEAFMGAKMSLALGGALLLWSTRSSWLSQLALVAASAMYASIMLIHLRVWTIFPDSFSVLF